MSPTATDSLALARALGFSPHSAAACTSTLKPGKSLASRSAALSHGPAA